MKNKIVLSLVLILGIILITHSCYAAVEIIPSKTNGTDAIVNTTVSNSYLLCQGMTGTGESLQGATVKPHLATNKDWGAVSYLSNSIYGTNTQGGNTGIEVTMNNVKYYSTTTNITGVMNWGSNPNGVYRFTQTAGLINSYDPSTSSKKENVIELYNNRNTKFVDYINPTILNETLGMASLEYNSRFTVGVSNDVPTSIRTGMFSGTFSRADGSVTNYADGDSDNCVTFRPVVWN